MLSRALTRPVSSYAHAYRGARVDRAIPRFAKASKLIIVGDSITQLNHFATSTKVSSRGSGYAQWAIRDLPGWQHLIWYDAGAGSALFRGANYGISGETATQVAARLTPIENSDGDLALLLVGTNTGATDALPATVVDKLETIITSLRGAGMHVVISTILPRQVAAEPTGSEISAALMNRILSINNWVRARGDDAVTVIDPWWELVDPAENQSALYGSPISGMYYDEVHPAAKGAFVFGSVARKALQGTMGMDQYNDTWFNADPTDASNRLLDGELAGSGGTARYGMTGTVPTNWVAECLNGGTNVTGVASVSSNSETGGQTQTLVLTSDGLGGATDQEQCAFLPLGFRVDEGSMTNGEWQQLFFKVRVRNNTDGVLGSLYAELRNNNTGVFGYGMEFRNGINAEEPWPTGDFDVWLISQPVQYNTSDVFTPQLKFPILGGVSGSVTIHVDCALLLGVADPDVTFPYTP